MSIQHEKSPCSTTADGLKQLVYQPSFKQRCNESFSLPQTLTVKNHKKHNLPVNIKKASKSKPKLHNMPIQHGPQIYQGFS